MLFMRRVLLLIVLITCVFQAKSQGDYLKFKSYQPYKWMVGLGWNVVDGYNHNNDYLILPYPTQLSVDRYFKYNLSAELAMSYSNYNRVFTTNSTVVTSSYDTVTMTTTYDTTTVSNRTTVAGSLAAVDLMCRYSFYRYMPQWFDPYVGLGVGLTYRMGPTTSFSPTVNVSAGMIFWVKRVGIRVQAMGKAEMSGGIVTSPNNYLAYSAGLQYKFPVREKSKSTFGKSKHGWVHKKTKFKGKSK